jgi:DNA-binding SARP family transcriptional activator
MPRKGLDIFSFLVRGWQPSARGPGFIGLRGIAALSWACPVVHKSSRIFHDLRGMYRLNLLGGLSLSGPAGPPVGRVMQRRRLAVLAVLAIAGRRAIARDRLLALLWPDRDAETARHLLADCLYVIRHDLGDDVLLTGDELRLNPGAIESDVGMFEDAIATGDLGRACSVYTGALLDGFNPGGSAELEQWVDTERERLARSCAAAMSSLATECEASGNAAAAIEWLRRLAALDPFDTRNATRLVRALTAADDPGAALRHARVHEALLREQLQVEPGPEFGAAVEEARVHGARRAEPSTPLVDEAVTDGAEDGRESAGRDDILEAPAASRWQAARAKVGGRWRTPAVAIAAASLLGALAVAAALTRLGTSPAAVRGEDDVVAIFPFEVSGPDAADFTAALHVLLTTRVDGLPGVVALDPHAVAAGPGGGALTPLAAARAATALGATSIVLGNAVIAGDRIELSAVRYAAMAPAQHTVRAAVEGPVEEIFALVDRLAAQLLAGGSAATGVVVRTAALTTASLPALKRFLDGEAKYRAGRFDLAAAAYADAVADDSGFALAWQRLALAQEWGGLEDRGRAAAAQALRHGDRLPPRAHQLVSAHAARLAGEFRNAERLYKAMLERYPDDAEGWSGLGEVYFHGNPPQGRSWRHAREPFERARALGMRAGGEPVFHLVSIAVAEERTAAVDSLMHEYLMLRPEALLATLARVQQALLRGDTTMLRSVAEQMLDAPARDRLFVVVMAAGTGRFAGALRFLDMLEAQERPVGMRVDARVLRIRLTAARWRWREASLALGALESVHPTLGTELRARLLTLPFAPATDEQLRSAAAALRALPPDTAQSVLRLYLRSQLARRSGQLDEAHEAADLLRQMAGGRAAAHAAMIDAQADRRAGRAQEALRHLAPELAAAGGTEFRMLRGELLLETGWPEQAVEWLHSAEMDWDAPLLRAQVSARLAQAYRALGSSAEADRYNRAFVRIRTEN